MWIMLGWEGVLGKKIMFRFFLGFNIDVKKFFGDDNRRLGKSESRKSVY